MSWEQVSTARRAWHVHMALSDYLISDDPESSGIKGDNFLSIHTAYAVRATTCAIKPFELVMSSKRWQISAICMLQASAHLPIDAAVNIMSCVIFTYSGISLNKTHATLHWHDRNDYTSRLADCIQQTPKQASTLHFAHQHTLQLAAILHAGTDWLKVWGCLPKLWMSRKNSKYGQCSPCETGAEHLLSRSMGVC